MCSFLYDFFPVWTQVIHEMIRKRTGTDWMEILLESPFVWLIEHLRSKWHLNNVLSNIFFSYKNIIRNFTIIFGNKHTNKIPFCQIQPFTFSIHLDFVLKPFRLLCAHVSFASHTHNEPANTNTKLVPLFFSIL